MLTNSYFSFWYIEHPPFSSWEDRGDLEDSDAFLQVRHQVGEEAQLGFERLNFGSQLFVTSIAVLIWTLYDLDGLFF